MAVGLDDALLGWLVESAGEGLVRWLRGDPAQAAMREVVESAVAVTVAKVAGDLTALDLTGERDRFTLD